MSGPVSPADAPPDRADGSHAGTCEVELSPSRDTLVGGVPIRRALPQRTRRTVGAWCFADHIGPVAVGAGGGLDIGPHPHIGLQTVTWLVAGEMLHRDSLGSEQVIRPGQLNLMTAGHGVSHAEEATGVYAGTFHGAQLWVAQPESTRDGPPAFEHHPELPRAEVGNATATVLIGELGGARSPARRDTDHVGADLELRPGSTVVGLEQAYEYAVVVLDGTVRIGPHTVGPGELAYLGSGRGELPLQALAPARALLLGGVPFEDRILMWWNYVARTRDEIESAHAAWSAHDARFGTVASRLARIDTGPPPWPSSRGDR